jgi:AMP deaminase
MTAWLFNCCLDVDKKPVFDIPTIREYFMDLDFVLGVISDGPTKSFAFRRLQYLRGKFTMYTLINEFQEMTEMKVRFTLFLDTSRKSPEYPDHSALLTGKVKSYPVDSKS